MSKSDKTHRIVKPKLWSALGTAAIAGLAAGSAQAASPSQAGVSASDDLRMEAKLASPAGKGLFILAQGEGEGEAEGGEGEAEGASGPTEADFLAALNFMEGHLRAGMALYEQGDLEAAKTHMGHPIEEKYDAVTDKLETRGFGDLRQLILALAAAAEEERDISEINPLFADVQAKLEEVRDASPGGEAAQLLSLAILTRIAADEYAVAVEGEGITNLHEYQDSWGFLRVVEDEAADLAQSDNEAVAKAAEEILAQVGETGVAYGNIQGEGDMTQDPSILYGAAARMELAARAVE